MLVPDSVTSPVSLSSLRSRTSDARNKMDQHKILLDRYLPLPVGPPNEVPYEVEYKFSELAERARRSDIPCRIPTKRFEENKLRFKILERPPTTRAMVERTHGYTSRFVDLRTRRPMGTAPDAMTSSIHAPHGDGARGNDDSMARNVAATGRSASSWRLMKRWRHLNAMKETRRR
ncbi:hypothetical protein LSH36_690g03076 [Paralvinella palmiformis]|uniref:Uncharacterized protein n=1 Tax=Paralvinella palmiformis TaxID=53620 RepID=A0AAD9MTX6_9ANNE|nr:hypothetical protein LSH36_690g03076 [Paralvinella palmiformis]